MSELAKKCKRARNTPSLVVLPFTVLDEVVLALEELCALDAVELAARGQVFGGLCLQMQLEMSLVAQVGGDLVDVATVAARLLLGVLTSDGRHGRCVPKLEVKVAGVRIILGRKLCDGRRRSSPHEGIRADNGRLGEQVAATRKSQGRKVTCRTAEFFSRRGPERRQEWVGPPLPSSPPSLRQL